MAASDLELCGWETLRFHTAFSLLISHFKSILFYSHSPPPPPKSVLNFLVTTANQKYHPHFLLRWACTGAARAVSEQWCSTFLSLCGWPGWCLRHWDTVSQSDAVLPLHSSVSYPTPLNSARADHRDMHGREAQVGVLEGRQGEGERGRAHLSKDCSTTSLTELKDSKDYRQSGEGIGWRCGHKKGTGGTHLYKRKL